MRTNLMPLLAGVLLLSSLTLAQTFDPLFDPPPPPEELAPQSLPPGPPPLPGVFPDMPDPAEAFGPGPETFAPPPLPDELLPDVPDPDLPPELTLAETPEPEAPALAPGKADKKLQLSTEQRRKLAESRVKLLKEIGPLESDLRVKEAELAVLWLSDELSEDKIIAKSTEIAALKAQLQEKHLRNRLALMKTLTPEQRKFLQARPGRRARPAGQRGFMNRGRMRQS
jgi:Spy/CpxP family protein refolding chaperone